MVALFLAWIVIYALIKPEGAPRTPASETAMPFGEKVVFTLKALLPPVLLVVSVIGSILAGIASVTEAAAVGAAGAVILNVIYRDFTWTGLWQATVKTVVISSMILLIVTGGTMFTSVFRLQGGTQLVTDFVNGLQLGPVGLRLLFLSIVFVLGALLDWV
jgi:TRAP-type mannitol/chloroaromatic compound transport system permease large subunit